MKRSPFIGTAGVVLVGLLLSPARAEPVSGWLNWRGPHQDGTTEEKGFPDDIEVDGENHLWSVELPGRSTPAIANGRLYIMGYDRSGPHLRERVVCLDAETGEKLWEHRYNDFLSDIIYSRYATSSPSIDPETGRVYTQGCSGLLSCFSPDGELLWQHSLMERYGMMNFPNGRTSSPMIDKDLVITHGITSNWGALGPGRDRFFAFDKKSGDLVWISTPGGAPQDSSFSTPVFSWLDGKRVFYCGTGDGRVVCVNARNGRPLWSLPLSQGGVNSSVLLHDEGWLTAIHAFENLDSGTTGRMVGLDIPSADAAARDGAPPYDLETAALERWRHPISCFTSSPTTHGEVVYQVSITGDLHAINIRTGEQYWTEELGIEQQYSSPVFADGKLYVGILEDPAADTAGSEDSTAGASGVPNQAANPGSNPTGARGSTAGKQGGLYVIRPSEDQRDYEIVSHALLEGRVFGSPVPYNQKLYLQTTEKLYCFGRSGDNPDLPRQTSEPSQWPEPGDPASLQIVPYDALLKPGETQEFHARVVDENGFMVETMDDLSQVQWELDGPLNAAFNGNGQLEADSAAEPSHGVFTASSDGLSGELRARVLPSTPYHEDFEGFELTEDHPVLEGEQFAYPYPAWIGARLKFEVRDLDGEQVLGKTTRIKLFQRGLAYIGHPEMSGYTIEGDVMTEGNRRKRGEVGFITHRYSVALRGQARLIEVNSNPGKFKVTEPFQMQPNTWYRLKTQVDLADDGSAVVRAKAWPRDESEPAEWTIEAPHETANRQGTPGLYGFSPQDMRVYIENVSVTEKP